MIRAAAVLAVFAAAFAIATSLVRPLVPWSSDHQLAARFHHLHEYGDRYEVLFFGTSTVRRSFIPRLVDQELAARGHDLHSFNFGTPRTFFFELDFIIREVLKEDLPNLRWVVIGDMLYMGPAQILGRDNDFTDRVVAWHTPGQLLDVFRSMALGMRWGEGCYNCKPAPILRYLPAAGLHVRHSAWRLTGYGQGDRIASSLLGWDQARLEEDLDAVAEQRGYEPLDVVVGDRQARARRSFLNQPEKYRRRVSHIDRMNAQPAPITQWDIDKIRGLIDAIRAAGAEPLFVITPVDLPTAPLYELHRGGVLPRLIGFNSPKQYPQLYRIDHRYDDIHLNARGAELFSPLFAKRFARVLDERVDD